MVCQKMVIWIQNEWVDWQLLLEKSSFKMPIFIFISQTYKNLVLEIKKKYRTSAITTRGYTYSTLVLKGEDIIQGRVLFKV